MHNRRAGAGRSPRAGEKTAALPFGGAAAHGCLVLSAICAAGNDYGGPGPA